MHRPNGTAAAARSKRRGRLRRRLLTGSFGRALVATVTAALLSTVVTAPPAAAATVDFPVMNTSESPPDGVWFRTDTNNNTERITGLGIYAGDVMSVECWSWGVPIGSYSNQIWYRGSNKTRPTAPGGRPNRGWMNTHYVNDGMTANNYHPAVPSCSVYDAPPPQAPTTSSSVAYYSGVNSAGAGQADALQVARVLTDAPNATFDGQWTSGVKCSPNKNAVNFAGANIKRLAGFSLGRLGPVYALNYLRWHNGAEYANSIDYVVMFDPGNSVDLLSSDSCDRYGTAADAGNTLGWWLTQPNTDHRLVILSGSRTAEQQHKGIQEAYFNVIRRNWPAARSKIIVCNYTYGHDATFSNLKSEMVNATRISTAQGVNSCPRQGNAQVWGWNP